MSFIEQIDPRVIEWAAAGVTAHGIAANLGRALTPAEDRVFRVAQDARAEDGRRRRSARGVDGEALSGAERKRRLLEREAAIDEQLDAGLERVDWDRRVRAEADPCLWAATYATGGLDGVLVSEPPDGLKPAVGDMWRAASFALLFHTRVARGYGKTSLAQSVCAQALATGRRRFIPWFSAAAPDAQQIVREVFAMFAGQPNIVQDYPEIAVPILMQGGSFKRRQFYGGLPTALRYSDTKGFQLAKIVAKKDFPAIGVKAGAPFPSSGAIFEPRGFDSRARGMKRASVRPDMVVLDDLQNDEEASSAELVRKKLEKIRRTILNLGGEAKTAALMTSTPIAPDDLSEQFARDPQWRTTTYAAFAAFPDDWNAHGRDGLWGRYCRIRETSIAMRAEDPTAEATRFYVEHRAEMDAGARVLNAGRFDASVGQVSAVQALMDKLFEIGPEAFAAEFQMRPRRAEYAFEITADMILRAVLRGQAQLTVPQGFSFVCAATDINPSYALTTTVGAFSRDRSCFVMFHAVQPIGIDSRLNDTAFHAAVYDALAAHGRMLRGLGVRINAWGIDAGGKQFDPVTAFCARAGALCGLPACALVGRAEVKFSGNVRTRIRDAVNETVLCGDARRGIRWMLWNADRYREAMQRAWNSEPGAPGGCSVYDSPAGAEAHVDFANQIANEKLVLKRANAWGRNEYTWRTKEPHDYGDCVAMMFAIPPSQGLAAGGATAPRPVVRAAKRRVIIR